MAEQDIAQDPVSSNSKRFKPAELQILSKEELVDRIRQLEFHVNQLKNVIAKGNGEKTGRPKPKSRPFDWSKHSKRHVALKIAYTGWDYKGFVVQEDTNKTIEHALFDALITAKLIQSRETSNYHRCGRTDKGVSAFCQVISIDLRSTQSSGVGVITAQSLSSNVESKKSELDYAGIMNRILPADIRVLAWVPVEVGFSARFDCNSRVYKYFFPRGDLSINLMNNAAKRLEGSHDFRNLCKMDVGNGVTNFMRHIDSAEVLGEDIDGYSTCTFTIISKAFLWHQIRCIMALIFMVGKGMERPEIVDELFDIEKNPCKPQYTMASELPLNLFDCSYEGLHWQYNPECHGFWTPKRCDYLKQNRRHIPKLKVVPQAIIYLMAACLLVLQYKEEVNRLVSHYQQLWSQNTTKSTMLRVLVDSLAQHTSTVPSCQADFLLADYRKHGEYRPLLTRTTCSSLEDRKEYFAKRRKLDRYLTSTDDSTLTGDQTTLEEVDSEAS